MIVESIRKNISSFPNTLESLRIMNAFVYSFNKFPIYGQVVFRIKKEGVHFRRGFYSQDKIHELSEESGKTWVFIFTDVEVFDLEYQSVVIFDVDMKAQEMTVKKDVYGFFGMDKVIKW